VAALVVLAVVACAGGGLYWIGGKLIAGAKRAAGVGGGVSGLSDDGKLTQVGDLALAGSGAVAAASDGSTAYYAVTGSNKTDVYSVPASGNGWHTAVAIEAPALRLTAVNGLLIVDGERAATHQGKDARSVLDAKTGKELRTTRWADRLDVTFIGTDEIVEVRSPPSVIRVDLRTGATRWTHTSSDSLVITDERRIGSAMTWSGAPANPGVPGLVSSGVPRTRSGLHDSLGASTGVVVEIDDNAGRGRVLDAATGNAKVSADVPLNIEEWVVFDGVVVGTLDSVVSAGRDVIAGYGMESLHQLWTVNLPAGASVDGIKPCGPRLVCVRTSGQSGGYAVTAIDVTDGRTAWEKTEAFDAQPWWYVLGDRLIYGKDWFGAIQDPKVLDPVNAAQSRSFGGGTARVFAEAGDGKRLVLLDSSVSLTTSNVTWNVAVGDYASGKGTGVVSVGTGDKLPEQIRLVGDLVTVITGDRHLRVLRVGGL